MQANTSGDKYEELCKLLGPITKTSFVTVSGDYLPIRFAFADILKAFKITPSGYDTDFVAAIASSGILPFSDGYNLLPKLHVRRCIASLQKDSLLTYLDKSGDKTSRQYIKLKPLLKCAKKIQMELEANPTKRFMIRFNKAVPQIASFTQKYHFDFWIGAKLQNVLTRLSEDEWVNRHPNFQAIFCDLAVVDIATQKEKIYSTDIGYRCNGIYTSMSGAMDKSFDSIGALHLLLLKEILFEAGFKCWDLGMHIDYKQGLGASTVPRQAFLGLVDICKKSFGQFPKEDIDLSTFQPFKNLLAWIAKKKADYREKYLNDKFSRRLSAEDRVIERTVPINQWTPEFLQKWFKIKIQITLPEISLDDVENPKGLFSKISKRKAKKAKKLLSKLAIKQKPNID